MQKIIIDAVGVPGQGGGAVVAELIQWLPMARPEWKFGVCLLGSESRDYEIPQTISNLEVLDDSQGQSYFSRIRWMIQGLPKLLAAWRPDALLSLSNLLPSCNIARKALLVHQSNILPQFSKTVNRNLKVRLRHYALRRAILNSARSAGAVMVQTQQMKQGLVDLDRGLAERVHVIPSGYRSELSKWPVRDEIRDAIRLGTGNHYLAYIAYPRPHKNHIRLLRAWQAVNRQLPGWKLLLTIDPKMNYQAMGCDTREIFDLIGSDDLRDTLILLGNLNPAEVDFTLRHSEALVFPSLVESFGLPLVEALNAQCPIVASDLPYAREITGNGAVYMNPISESDMADKILRLATNRALRESLRGAGAERAPLFSYQKIANQYCQVLEQLCTEEPLPCSR